jgi:hypothetical protein
MTANGIFARKLDVGIERHAGLHRDFKSKTALSRCERGVRGHTAEDRAFP